MDSRSSKGTRRYHKSVPYMLPNDMAEVNRLDFQHYVLRSILRGNYQAPISNPSAILDVGCGTGAWGHDMAREFQDAYVLGLDLEYVEKQDVPENYHFEAANILQGIPYEDEQFDFVHQRFLINAIPKTIWPGMIRELVRVTRPGGWIELVEVGCDPFVPGGDACQEIFESYVKLSKMNNMDVGIIRSLGMLLQQEGMTLMKSMTRRAPVGSWGGREGSLLARDMSTGIMALRDAFVRFLDYAPSQFEYLHQQVVREWNQHQSECVFYFFVARKE
jgi:ubiquinone/menaquinone biosynthesis C-methylase UbiE